MAPAQRQTYVSISLGSWVLTRQNFHFVFIYTFAPKRVYHRCTTFFTLESSVEERYAVSLILFPSWPVSPPPQFVFNTLSGPYKWVEPFNEQEQPWTRSGTTHITFGQCYCLAGWGKKRTFSIYSVFKLRIEKVTLYSQ